MKTIFSCIRKSALAAVAIAFGARAEETFWTFKATDVSRDGSFNGAGASALAATWNTDLASAAAHMAAERARVRGYDIVDCPEMLIGGAENAQGAICEDPMLAARIVSAYVRALQRHDVAARVGGFPPKAKSLRELNDLHLPAFRSAIKGAGARVVGLSGDASKYYIQGILRERWGFTGVVEGEHDEERERRLAEELKMTGDVMQTRETGEAEGLHQLTELRIAREAIVLMKNASGVLPLDIKKLGSIVVAGSLANKPFSREGATALEALKEYVYEAGEEEEGQVKTRISFLPLAASEELRSAVQSADATVVFACSSADHEAALSEMKSWNITNLVVIALGDKPIRKSWTQEVQTLVAVPDTLAEGARALSEIIFGEVNPSGKLVFTWPKETSGANQEEPDDFGYRRCDREGTMPAYPFGHGLSYTKFEYDMEKAEVARFADEIGWAVSLPVKNAGDAPGKEAVQIYVSYPNAKKPRAVKVLKGFAKTKLLSSGEGETLKIAVSPRDLAYWDDFTNRFRLDQGECEILVGASALDIRGRAKITITRDYEFTD